MSDDPTKPVRDRWLKALDELERNLDNPNRPHDGAEGLMKQWGALLVETSQRAFVDQRLGDDEWPPRYPNMEPPFINIAGALSDFNAGKSKPKNNRFNERPALVDQGLAGGIWGSITFAASKNEVEVGTNKPYGKIHQEGGESDIAVTDEGYRKGYDWLFTDRIGTAVKGREGYIKKLWPALSRRFLHQNVAKRPFLGVTAEAGQDLVKATQEYFEGEQLGGGRIGAAV